MGLLAPAPCSVCLRHGVQYQTKKSQYIQFLKNQNVKTFKRGVVVYRGFPGGSDGEESACNAGDPGLIPGLERSPGEGNGNPLQCSCLENSMDRGAWRVQSLGSQRVGLSDSHRQLLKDSRQSYPPRSKQPRSLWSSNRHDGHMPAPLSPEDPGSSLPCAQEPVLRGVLLWPPG